MASQITIPSLEGRFLQAFDEKLSKEIRINILFFAILTLEIVALLLFFPFFLKSALVAFMIALFVMTVFGFALLRQYLFSQKQAFFKALIDEYGTFAKEVILYQEENPKSPVDLAKFYIRLAEKLYHRELTYYLFSSLPSFLLPVSETLGSYLHGKDVFIMREFLLEEVIHEHVKLVKLTPLSCEAHALLANAYVLLAGLYWKEGSEKKSHKIDPKFTQASHAAIEEFKILKEYTPHDPWVYAQLAYSYRDLKLVQEEKAAYEYFLQLKPDDHDVMYKLGILYFNHGEKAKGLKIYEALKSAEFSKADELLAGYGGIK